ncbi:MAG: NAD(P)/FAD-dependent oxidoreductase [Lachnospiraceae bacterium]|nr:NAD(P)/FAD-dependent oxidoreductase [Lachnospiraceae bacterium]
MAAFSAASAGAAVTVFDRNEKAGKKIYITGKGRCNFTNLCSAEDFQSRIVTNPRFLYSALHGLTPEDTVRFFEESGCPTKVERGNRAFPKSDHASDIIRALQERCVHAGVRFRFREGVRDILTEDGGDGAEKPRICGILTESGERIGADAVILATGGCSYPSTGSTGDGYRMAEALGHRTTPREPSLVPFLVEEAFCGELQGLTLKNVSLTMHAEGVKKPVFSGQGEMLFTHFGVSGPLVLSASAHYHKGMKAGLTLDLKPALSFEQLDARLIREFEEKRAKFFKNALDDLFPAKLIPVMVRLSGIPPMQRAGEIDKKSRQAFARLIGSVPMTVTGTRGFTEAVITRGGVDVRDIDPHTMASRCVDGLYFAGEVIDTDALTGGYNLQIAWSTGRLAGLSAAGQ